MREGRETMMCPVCRGTMRWNNDRYMCAVCGFDDTPKPNPSTNADRIRAMTDEELAQYLDGVCHDLWQMFVKDPKKCGSTGSDRRRKGEHCVSNHCMGICNRDDLSRCGGSHHTCCVYQVRD